MRVRLLGPVELLDGAGSPVPLGGAKERVLLAALALNVGEPVATSRLIDALWGDDPPRTAAATLRSHLSRLRRACADAGLSLVSVPGGSRLDAPDDAVDVKVVERLVSTSRAAATPEGASEGLAAALAIWRGAALGDLADRAFAAADAARLEEFRTSILEQRVAADLACGRHAELVGELESLCEAHPYREGLWASRILALYRAGRQAEALRAYADLRRQLADDLGIDPSPALRELEAAVLAQSESLDWRGPTSERVRAAAMRRLPPAPERELVGRRRELAVLAEAWERARSGAPNMVLLAGDPGIGKTRLALELARQAEAGGALAVYGRADERTSRPYGPVAEALERLLGSLQPAELSALGGLVGELTTLLSGAGDRLGSRGGELADRDAVFAAVVEVLGRVTGGAPLLVVLDDLQWAGPETFLLLQHVLRSPVTARVLAIGTYRDGEAAPDHPVRLLPEHEDVGHIRLGGLAEDDVAVLVEDAALAGQVHRRSGGNPFVALELAAHLRDPWRAPEAELPSTVRDLLRRRFRWLGEPAYGVLRVAAVLGREFPCRLLEEVAGVDGGDVLDALDAAVEARLVEDLGGGRFAFAHDLVIAALLSELHSARRARIHRQVAELLVARDDADAEVLAHHALEAVADGLPLHVAVDAALRCAAQATEQLAPERAVEVLDRALEIVEASVRPDRVLRCELRLAKADVLEFAGDRGALRPLALAAAEDARLAGSAEQLARCAQRHYGWGEVGAHDDTTVALCREALDLLPADALPWRSTVLAVLAQVVGNGESRVDEAIELAEEAVSLARGSGDAEALVVALAALDRSRLGRPDVARRLAVNDELVQIATRAGDEAMRFAGIRQQAAVRLELGDLAGFEAERRAMERLHERLGSWISRFWTRAYRATGAMVTGRFDEAERVIDELADDLGDETNAVTMWAGMQAMLRREQGRALEVVPTLEGAAAMFPSLAIFPVGAAAFLAEGGDLAAARPRYEALVADELAAVPRDQTLAACAAGLTEVAVRLRDPAGARALLPVLSPYTGQLVTTGAGTFCFASADRLVGMLRFVLDDLDGAVDAHDQALQLELGMGALPFAARTRRWLGEALLARAAAGDVGRAAAELAEAMEDACRIGMPGLVAEIEPLLAWATGMTSPTAGHRSAPSP